MHPIFKQALEGIAPKTAPVFLSEKVDEALARGALNEAATIIITAENDKREGYGPPLSEIISAKRKWLDHYHAARTKAEASQ